jgi:hypothetical protein
MSFHKFNFVACNEKIQEHLPAEVADNVHLVVRKTVELTIFVHGLLCPFFLLLRISQVYNDLPSNNRINNWIFLIISRRQIDRRVKQNRSC